jgi:glycerophosphoryl diester phosphodiesterase
MPRTITLLMLALLLVGLAACDDDDDDTGGGNPDAQAENIQLGPRPYFVVQQMEESDLKDTLEACAEDTPARTDFSIGHRGAGLQFPEHTRESYVAAARMGAGIVECDVTFTQDRELVCRHSQCDLHTTTDILARPELAAKCTQPFTPADPTTGTPASALHERKGHTKGSRVTRKGQGSHERVKSNERVKS